MNADDMHQHIIDALDTLSEGRSERLSRIADAESIDDLSPEDNDLAISVMPIMQAMQANPILAISITECYPTPLAILN